MPRPHLPWLLALLAISVLLRLGVAFYLGDGIEEIRGGTHDQISYDALAQRLAEGHGFSFAVDWWPYARANQPTAFWSYLYTLYLAGVYAIFGHHPLAARLVQAIAVGLLMPWLVYRIGQRSFGERPALLAAGVVALYAYFITYAASLMTESFYVVGILWTLDTAMRLAQRSGRTPAPGAALSLRLGLELGIAMAFTLLLRQVVLAFYPLLLLWILWVSARSKALRRTLPSVALSVLVLALLIAPFVVRNYQVFGRLTLPNTNAGFTFFWSNHPIYGVRFEAVLSPAHGVSYQELIPPELRGLNEAELDSALMKQGLQFVRDDPGRYLRLSSSRIPVFFLFWPTSQSSLLSNVSRLFSFGLGLPFMVYGLFLALRDLQPGRRRPGADMRVAFVSLLLLFISLYTAIHLLSWANVRYRLPVDAVLILFAGNALHHLWASLQSRQQLRSLARPRHNPTG